MSTQDNSYPTHQELLNQINMLTSELQEERISNKYLWTLYVETGRRLQVASASIKAAISSLMSYDIFWDPVNQHEFYQTINVSADIVSKLVMLLTLAFRSEANSLILKSEPQILQEILASLQTELSIKDPNFVTEFTLPDSGKPVLVDFEYLIFALRYLFEFLRLSMKSSTLSVEVSEEEDLWNVDIVGVNDASADIILEMHHCKTSSTDQMPGSILPENILGLHLACEILHMQGIDIDLVSNSENDNVIRLMLPTKNQ